jgi:hypothetical protein
MKVKWTTPIASFFSSLLAIVCPLCIPTLGAFLASVGLGFALNVRFLRSLLVGLLVLAVTSLAWSIKYHGKWIILLPAITGAGLIYAGRYLWFNTILMWLGAIVLIVTSVINLRLKANCEQCL